MVGTPPFGLFGEDIIQNILAGIEHVDMREISGVARDLILRLLIRDPNLRLGNGGSQEVLDHPFMEIRGMIKPSQSLMNGIISWSEFIEDTEVLSEADPFKDF